MVVWVLRRGLGAPARSGCSGVVSALRRGLGAPAWSGSSAGVPVTPGGRREGGGQAGGQGEQGRPRRPCPPRPGAIQASERGTGAEHDSDEDVPDQDDGEHPCPVDGECHGCSPSSRSKEHTSELQSRFDLVCRLLLEKKNLHISSMNCTLIDPYINSHSFCLPPM